MDLEFQNSIKERKEKLFQIIETAKRELEDLRKVCEHPRTSEGNFSYRVGNIQRALICDDCGVVVELLDIPEIDDQGSMWDLVN